MEIALSIVCFSTCMGKGGVVRKEHFSVVSYTCPTICFFLSFEEVKNIFYIWGWILFKAAPPGLVNLWLIHAPNTYNMPQRMSQIKTYPDSKSEAQAVTMVIVNIWDTNQEHFPTTYLLPLTCQYMSLVYPNNAFLERNRLSLRESSENSRQGHLSECCFWWISARGGCLDCDDSMSLTSPHAFALECLAKVMARRVCVWGCFSTAMLQWLPVTQGSDQYWISGAAEQAAKGLEWMCSIGCVMCGVSMVAEAVQPSHCRFREYTQTSRWRYTCMQPTHRNN